MGVGCVLVDGIVVLIKIYTELNYNFFFSSFLSFFRYLLICFNMDRVLKVSLAMEIICVPRGPQVNS